MRLHPVKRAKAVPMMPSDNERRAHQVVPRKLRPAFARPFRLKLGITFSPQRLFDNSHIEGRGTSQPLPCSCVPSVAVRAYQTQIALLAPISNIGKKREPG